jgi:hypothetical protein
MSSESLSRLRAPLIALFLMSAMTYAPVHAAEGLRKVTVVSFGLFGDQGVFRREAIGAAQIVESRFGHGSVVVRFNDRRRCDHQIACSNIAGRGKKDGSR